MPEIKVSQEQIITAARGVFTAKGVNPGVLFDGSELPSSKQALEFIKDPETPIEVARATQGYLQLIGRDPKEVIERYKLAEKITSAKESSKRTDQKRHAWREDLERGQAAIANHVNGNSLSTTLVETTSEKLKDSKVIQSQPREDRYDELADLVIKKLWKKAKDAVWTLKDGEEIKKNEYDRSRKGAIKCLNGEFGQISRAQEVRKKLEDKPKGQPSQATNIEMLNDIIHYTKQLTGKMESLPIEREEKKLFDLLNEIQKEIDSSH